MKLSKAQQDVMDKMREGWIIINASIPEAPILVKKVMPQAMLNINTFYILLRSGIIERYDDSFPEPYQLTEKYRSNER